MLQTTDRILDDTRAALAGVLAEHPTLTGVGWLDPRRPNFDQSRAALANLDASTWTALLAWCRDNLAPTRGINPRRMGFSYFLKHAAEDSIGVYVSNGALIAALLACGYGFRRDGTGPNCHFNVTMATPGHRVYDAGDTR